MRRVRYNRICEPNLIADGQLNDNISDEIIFNDVVSCAVPFREREKARELIKLIEEGLVDIVYVEAIDHLGKSISDLVDVLEYFTAKNVILRIDNLDLESKIDGKLNPSFKLSLNLLIDAHHLERSTKREKQLQGIAIAKTKGIYKGRAKGTALSEESFLEKYSFVVEEIQSNPKFSVRKVAEITGVSKGTVQNVKQKMISKDPGILRPDESPI